MRIEYRGIITNIDLDEFSNGMILITKTFSDPLKGYSETSTYTLKKLELFFKEIEEKNKKVYVVILKPKKGFSSGLWFKTLDKKKSEELYKQLKDWIR